MAEKHVIVAIALRFEEMSCTERIVKIRKLAGASAAATEFIRETFPELYREAMSAREVVTSSHFPKAGRREQP
jgi:hypothetical protein